MFTPKLYYRHFRDKKQKIGDKPYRPELSPGENQA